MQTIHLNTTTQIPLLGFGTWQLTGEEARKPLETALEIGYRHIDTADYYHNHQIIGSVLEESGLPREAVFVTTKVWRSDLRSEDLIRACERSLDELKLTYLDLYLIHWPNKEVPIMETLEAMQELKDNGLIRAIGVSNFDLQHIDEAVKTGIEITNNQVELHPTFNQKGLREHCDRFHVTITAYSPIAQGMDLKLKVVTQLAKQYDVKPSQVILAWLRQSGIIAIPKATSKAHIKENFESLLVQLKPEDMSKMDEIEQRPRMVLPDFAEFRD